MLCQICKKTVLIPTTQNLICPLNCLGVNWSYEKNYKGSLNECIVKKNKVFRRLLKKNKAKRIYPDLDMSFTLPSCMCDWYGLFCI